ncbi:sigma-54-dependent Fis family transcriptional regulator [Candidatus Poribacteria bacterium]|nr:sigma-54-dependent Fis family transcriptional regulator [Candidatus Poribacteria bacterium]
MARNKSKNAHILIVDDDPLVKYSLEELLSLEGYPVKSVYDAESALATLQSTPCDVVIADINLPGVNGFDLLTAVKDKYPDIVVILITGYGTIEDAVKGIKLGAYEYITKPLNDDEVKISIERAVEQKNLRLENLELKRKLAEKFQFENLIGSHNEMQKVFHLVSVVADSEATILINGASGTGKSTIARAIHYHSRRKEKPLVEISCGALSENLLESELFGHVRGAFTTALTDKVGKIEKAEGGTVFLDEIDTLSLRLQVKLLRFLQDKKFERVGSTDTIHSNVRVIAAANRDLARCVGEGEFREDLFYRLNVVSMRLPLLKDHLSDIPTLVDHFIAKYNKINSKKVRGISNEVMKRFLSWPWPGNIRELENTIERAIILCDGEHVGFDLLPDYLHANDKIETSDGLVPLEVALDIAEKKAISKTLQHFKGNRNKTAEFLEVNRTTLYQKMKRHALLDVNYKET